MTKYVLKLCDCLVVDDFRRQRASVRLGRRDQSGSMEAWYRHWHNHRSLVTWLLSPDSHSLSFTDIEGGIGEPPAMKVRFGCCDRKCPAPDVEEAQMELERRAGAPKHRIKVSAGHPKIGAHHAIADGVTGIKNGDIMRGVSRIMSDVEDACTGPSALRNHLKEVTH